MATSVEKRKELITAVETATDSVTARRAVTAVLSAWEADAKASASSFKELVATFEEYDTDAQKHIMGALKVKIDIAAEKRRQEKQATKWVDQLFGDEHTDSCQHVAGMKIL